MENLAKSLEQLLGKELLAVYSYEQFVKVFVPVIIVKTMNFELMSELKKDFQGKQFIILTEDDIINGADIFALKYLHMMKHSDLLVGKDLFLKITIDKSDLRNSLEYDIRSKLIQLRESFLSFQGAGFLELVLPVMEVLWEGILVYADIVHEDAEGVALLPYVTDLCACNMDVFQYLYEGKAIDKDHIDAVVEKVNQHLNVLRDFLEKA